MIRGMRDSDLTDRSGQGLDAVGKDTGDHDIEKVWWMARVLHFPKLNVSCWFDGRELVAIEHWGYRRAQWTMKKPPADHPPLPAVYKRERERAKQEALDRVRAAAEARMLALIQASGKRQSTPDADGRS